MRRSTKKILKSVSITILLILVNLINGPTPVFASSVSDSYADATKINISSSTNYQVYSGQLKMDSVPATGGTITYTDSSGLNPRSSPSYPGGYTVHTFTSSGTFTSPMAINVEALVVAGGGGGGEGEQNLAGDGAGGGGAGGIVYNASYAVTTGAKTVTVGNGGTGSTTYAKGGTGNNSVFDSITAYGGGGGGSEGTSAGANGGSGGGAGNAYEGATSGGTATPSGQGNNGGNATTNYTTQRGGSGGGGASAVGTTRTSAAGGAGGTGTAYTISGSSVTYGGGGGGGSSNNAAGGTATGGGGAGGQNGNGTAGTANTGGGGGGGGAKATTGGYGGNGGSGIVIIRYPTASLTSNYYTSSTIISTNLLSEATGVDGIDEFVYNLSSLPANTTATVQFSQNGTTWYNSSGVENGTDDLTTGVDNTINIHDLTWSGSNFYYKVVFTGDGSDTPVLDDITLNYTAAGYTNTSGYNTDPYNDNSKINISSSSNYFVTNGYLKSFLTSSGDIGDGADGEVTISSSKNINTDVIKTGRSYADGVNYAVSAISTNTVTTSATPNGILAGDEVLLINMQGAAASYSSAGNYEFLTVQGVAGSVITFTGNVTGTYGVGGNSDLTGQKIVVQRVPNYTNVTIDGGVTLTASAWNGTSGGIVVFRANGTFINNGTIHTNYLGYRGGAVLINGESYAGTAASYSKGNISGGGTASPNNGGATGGGGGGGKGRGDSPNQARGGGGGGAGYGGGGGGGGGGACSPNWGSACDSGNGGGSGISAAGGGGGSDNAGATGTCGAGGNAPNAGSPGVNGTPGQGGQAGSGTTSGSGAGANQGGGGGGGGATYGTANLSNIFLGSGGGGGGLYGLSSSGAETGGNGGGIIMLFGNTITNTGSITSTGANSVAGSNYNGGSGAGSGGSILIKGINVTLGSGLITASGGTKSSTGTGSGGGGGGVGRIAVSATSSSGTTTPTYSEGVALNYTLFYNSPAAIVSTNLLSGVSSVKSIDTFEYSLTSLPANTTATIQFSQDATYWYNSSGAVGGTDNLSIAGDPIELSTLGWTGPYFYYKLTYTSDGTDTPVMDYITLNYTMAIAAASSSWAACRPLPGGDFTISANCFFPNTFLASPDTNIDGVDNGDLTIDAYKTLTVRGDQIIVRNNGQSIVINGTIAINDIPVGGIGGNVRDYSANNNEGTANGSTVVAGKYTNARYFNGSSNYVDLGNSALPQANGASSLTLAAWVKVAAFPSSGNRARIIATNIDATGKTGFSLNFYNNAGSTVLEAGGRSVTSDSYQTSTVSFTDTTEWHHVAGVFNFAADTITLYVDGVGQAPSSVSFGNDAYTLGTPASNTNDGIGGFNAGGAWGAFFTGTIDDLRVYNYGRSEAQINEDMNYAPNPTGNIPIAWYRFEDGGQIKETNLWAQDNDGNGWSLSWETNQKAQESTPGTGWVRRNTIIGSAFGDARDGNITFTTNTNLSTTNHTGRTCADGGDAVAYNISSLGSTSLPAEVGGATVTTATLSSTPSSGCLVSGDNVLVMNLQGTSSSTTNTGNYEMMKIYSVSGTAITFTSEKNNYYGDGIGDDTNLGTGTSNQKVVLQRVPQYGNVTINGGVTVNANAWNGNKGGVVTFQVKDTLTNSGTISASGLGFRGGVTSGTYAEGIGGYIANVGGGANGGNGSYYTDTCYKPSSTCLTDPHGPGGGGGGGGGYAAGGGGGAGSGCSGLAGSYLGSASGGSGGTVANDTGGGGGGGGHYTCSCYGMYAGCVGVAGGSVNMAGSSTSGCVGTGVGGAAGSGINNGGNGGTASSGSGGGGGAGYYGVANLSKIYFGGGGGAGGTSGCYVGESWTNCPGITGGAGGGIIAIYAKTITAGTITAGGANGGNAVNRSGGAGGGAGGSILIMAYGVSVSSSVSSSGGTGGTGGGTDYGGAGAGGGIGRIAMGTVLSSGNTNPDQTDIAAP